MATLLPVVDFPAAVASLPPLPKYSEQDFLDLFQRLLPDHYLQPLIDPGPGYEMLQAYAAMAARISEAVEHVGTGNFILSAGDGSYSEGDVEFYRDATVFGAFTLLPGTVVATADGYTYTTLDEVAFTASDLGPHTSRVRATVRGWLYNKPGQQLAADGSTIPGSVNIIVRPNVPTTGTSNYDPTVAVRQTTDIVGGAAPMLDGLGLDRGLPRRDGEVTELYRARLTRLPDTVTPTALKRQAASILGNKLNSQGERLWLVEGWDLRVQMCWDATPNVTVSSASDVKTAPTCTDITNFTQNVFVWDYDPETMGPTAGGIDPYGWPVSNRLLAAGAYSSTLLVAGPQDPALEADWYALATTLEAIKPAGVTIRYLYTEA